MAIIADLPTSTILRRIAEIRDDIKSAREDSSLSAGERMDLVSDLFGDLARYRDELEYRGS